MHFDKALVYVPLAVLLFFAAITDIRARRIPNWLSMTVIVTGLAQSFTPWTLVTPQASVWGLLAGFAVTFLMYVIGGRGAGDVKLTAGIGAWIGPWPVVIALCAAAVLSMVAAVVRAISKRRFSELCNNTVMMILGVTYIRRLGTAHVIETSRNHKSIDEPLPNAVSMLIATLGVIGWIVLHRIEMS